MKRVQDEDGVDDNVKGVVDGEETKIPRGGDTIKVGSPPGLVSDRVKGMMRGERMGKGERDSDAAGERGESGVDPKVGRDDGVAETIGIERERVIGRAGE